MQATTTNTPQENKVKNAFNKIVDSSRNQYADDGITLFPAAALLTLKLLATYAGIAMFAAIPWWLVLASLSVVLWWPTVKMFARVISMIALSVVLSVVVIVFTIAVNAVEGILRLSVILVKIIFGIKTKK